jgi:hypothetical protein
VRACALQEAMLVTMKNGHQVTRLDKADACWAERCVYVSVCGIHVYLFISAEFRYISAFMLVCIGIPTFDWYMYSGGRAPGEPCNDVRGCVCLCVCVCVQHSGTLVCLCFYVDLQEVYCVSRLPDTCTNKFQKILSCF